MPVLGLALLFARPGFFDREAFADLVCGGSPAEGFVCIVGCDHQMIEFHGHSVTVGGRHLA